MRNALEVTAWVRVREDCSISYTLNVDDEVELLFGGRYDGFELLIPTHAIGRLAEVAALAAAEAERRPDDAA